MVIYLLLSSLLKSLSKLPENSMQRLPSKDRSRVCWAGQLLLSLLVRKSSPGKAPLRLPSPASESLEDATTSKPGGWLVRNFCVVRKPPHLLPFSHPRQSLGRRI